MAHTDHNKARASSKELFRWGKVFMTVLCTVVIDHASTTLTKLNAILPMLLADSLQYTDMYI